MFLKEFFCDIYTISHISFWVRPLWFSAHHISDQLVLIYNHCLYRLNVCVEKVASRDRERAKRVVYAIVYGVGELWGMLTFL